MEILCKECSSPDFFSSPCNWLMQLIHLHIFSSLLFPWPHSNGWSSHDVASSFAHVKMRSVCVCQLLPFFLPPEILSFSLLQLYCSKNNVFSTIVHSILIAKLHTWESLVQFWFSMSRINSLDSFSSWYRAVSKVLIIMLFSYNTISFLLLNSVNLHMRYMTNGMPTLSILLVLLLK